MATHRTFAWLVALMVIVAAAVAPLPGDERISEAPSKPKAPPGTAGPPAASAAASSKSNGDFALEAQFNDDSALKMKVLDEFIELKTPYGKLVIPVSDIRVMELAARVTDEEAKAITEAVAQLNNEDYDKREAASAALEEFGEKAYAALTAAAASDIPERARRAKMLIDKIGEEIGEDRLETAAYDIIETDASRIAGTITATTLKVTTSQFGELKLKLADVRTIRSGAAAEKEPSDVMPDPGNLSAFSNQIGKTLHIRVTGAAAQTGSLYGTGTYTTDSQLAVAVVHCGLIKTGETKVVAIRIVGPHTGFTGSTQNGFTSASYSSYNAYEVVMPKRKRAAAKKPAGAGAAPATPLVAPDTGFIPR